MNSAFLALFFFISLTSSHRPVSYLPFASFVPSTDPSRFLVDSSTYQPRYHSKCYPNHTQRIPQGYNLHFVQNLAKMPHLLYNTIVLYTFCIVFDLFRQKIQFQRTGYLSLFFFFFFLCFMFLCSITYFAEKMHKFYEKNAKTLAYIKKKL